MKCKYEIESMPKQFYSKERASAVNLGTSVIFIDNNGWLIKKYQSNGEEIRDIIMSEHIAGIVCKNKIYIISF